MSKTMMTRAIIVVAVLGTLVIITLGIFHPAQPGVTGSVTPGIPSTEHVPQVGVEQGDAAPNFTVRALDGRRVSLSDYRGKLVMLNFWSINCAGCQAEIPGMQTVYAEQQRAHKDFVILGVNLADNATDVAQFVHQRGLTYPIALDRTIAIASLYALRGTPTSYFIDRHGIIHSRVEGPVDETTLQHIISELNV